MTSNVHPSLERERQRILWRQRLLASAKGRELLSDLYRRVRGKETMMGPGSIPPEMLEGV